jgi:hypothetical protein
VGVWLTLLPGGPDPRGVFTIVYGLLVLIPPVFVLCVGLDYLFEFMARRFDRNNAQSDGAFIAEMLATGNPEVRARVRVRVRASGEWRVASGEWPSPYKNLITFVYTKS